MAIRKEVCNGYNALGGIVGVFDFVILPEHTEHGFVFRCNGTLLGFSGTG